MIENEFRKFLLIWIEDGLYSKKELREALDDDEQIWHIWNDFVIRYRGFIRERVSVQIKSVLKKNGL